MSALLRGRAATVATVAAWMTIATILGSCGGQEVPVAQPTTPPAAAAASLQDRIARGLIAASPTADPADARARDAAAQRLSQLGELLGATGERILWGGFDAQKGYNPQAYRLTEFSPLVWAKVYLSTFTFPGAYEVRREGSFTVVEVEARFRDGLDSGDYPYPFWHSEKKWQAYATTRAVLLIFERDQLVAAYRKAAPDPAPTTTTARKWDGRWRWTDAHGEQPRVTLFTYLLSPDNPSLAKLDRAYRALEDGFRRTNCVGCHAPDDVAKASSLVLLDFPNQALVARHSLVETLRRNKMPPANHDTGALPGLADEAVRGQLLVLAEQFEREADAALAFERAHPANKIGAHP
jgi:hypothetical protein